MGFLSSLFSAGLSGIMDSTRELADEFFTSGEERAEFQLKAKALFQERLSELEQTARTELQAKERVLVAELNQGDRYVKRARPTIVYAGLATIVYNYSVAPTLGFGALPLPDEFWLAFGAVVSTWSIGRTVERVGVSNAFTRKVTGTKAEKTILDF